MRKFGLIGRKLGHSFSKRFFTEKFEREGIQGAVYNLYELDQITEFPELLMREPELVGLNVTVPYKEVIIPFLDELDAAAASIGAINTIRVENGKTVGYNTDYIGFKQTLEEFYPVQQEAKALVLGTGGAAKAVLAALRALGIGYTEVSRTATASAIDYKDLDATTLSSHKLIINTTPLGMYPATEACPPLPYHLLTPQHYLYDLVYNPEQTLFMKKGAEAGAATENGLAMLYKQAEAAWAIWNS
ncbi:shikimate dehydrogenase [Pontibacter qinzhouensis]|uniref:Shikimate dehydrogenase n=1 Tax=Pontibacter qinzhouensis TaxID=2603253 RepID=A0A5C8JIG5_9BACT|nr:shikimate dehydrogenase [Pontibacter qinzhouensis]TXK36514.1 shikimate dehydrogenase [Pontibacter qinzhouensis]